jgi:hypothetical protein
MKLEKARKALPVIPLIALAGALAIMLGLTGSAAAWSGAVYVTTNGANDSDAAVNPTNGHVHMAWYDGTTDYWYAECDPNTNTCTNPVDISVLAGAMPVHPDFATTEALRPGVTVDSVGNTYVGFPNPAVGPGSGGVAVILKKAAGGNSFTQFATLGPGWQVRLGSDSSNKVHAVWGSSGQLNYRKFGPGGNLLVDDPNFTNGDGQGSHMAVDAAGNAHVVYEGNINPGPKIIKYQQIAANGTVGAVKTVYSDPNAYNAINPDVAVDVNGKLHFAWRDSNPNNIQILYKRCDPGALANCTATTVVNTDGVMGDDVSIATLRSNYFIAYQQQLSAAQNNARIMMVYFGTTGQLTQVDGQSNEFWPSIRGNPATGELNLTYRLAQGNFNLIYRHQNCGCTTGGSTFTPTVRPTATVGATTNTPTPTVTPTTTGPGITLTNLTHNPTTRDAPSIALSASGERVVAWEQKAYVGGNLTWSVFVDTAPDGIFGGPVKFSSGPSWARSPFLLQSQNGVYMLYRDTLTGTSNFKVMGAEWNGATWTSATRVDQASFMDEQTPAGIQLPNGPIWFTWQGWESGTWTDTIAQPIGGTTVNVSNDGSAVNHASIAYGDGNLYIAWVDHANERVGNMSPGIYVARYDGTAWTRLPVPTTEYTAAFPTLAYANHNLYLVWRSSAPPSIKSAVWNGSTWGSTTRVLTSSGIQSLSVFAPASGNLFIAWENSGKIYLQENQNTPILVSSGVPRAHQPSLFVDGADTAYLAFQNADIWYARVKQ